MRLLQNQPPPTLDGAVHGRPVAAGALGQFRDGLAEDFDEQVREDVKLGAGS